MRTWSAFLLVSWLPAQDTQPKREPIPTPPAPCLKLRATPLTPQAMLKAMVAQDQARRTQPGATVEVIGTDDEAALQLLSLTVTEQVRLDFRNIDNQQHQELYAFMHQDPSHPTPVLFVPNPAGGRASTAEDKWLR